MINEIAAKVDKKVPLGRKYNPYGKRAILKAMIKSIAERERSKAGVTKETTDLKNELIRKAKKNIKQQREKNSLILLQEQTMQKRKLNSMIRKVAVI